MRVIQDTMEHKHKALLLWSNKMHYSICLFKY